jgi:hypothetical protein
MQKVAPAAEYAPGEHWAQTESPALARKVPAAQFEHAAAPNCEVMPPLHATHADDADAPAVVEYRPAAHGLHITVPAEDAYRPTTHASHAVDTDAPVVVRYRPAAHGVQVTVLVAAAY